MSAPRSGVPQAGGADVPRPPARWFPFVVGGVLPLLAGLFLAWTIVPVGVESWGWGRVVWLVLLGALCCWRAYGLACVLAGRRPPRVWETRSWTLGPTSPVVDRRRGPRAMAVAMWICAGTLVAGLGLSWLAGAAVSVAETFGGSVGEDVTATVTGRAFQPHKIGGRRGGGQCQGQRITFAYVEGGREHSFNQGYCDNNPLSRLQVGDTVPARTVPGSSELLVDHTPGEARSFVWAVLLGGTGLLWMSVGAAVRYWRLVHRGADLYVGQARVVDFDERVGVVLQPVIDSDDLRPYRLGVARRRQILRTGDTVRVWATRLDWRGQPAGPWVVRGPGSAMAMTHAGRVRLSK